jgi:hypothetical protein
MAFSPDGKTLLSGSEDATLLLWNIRGAERVAERLTAAELEVYWEALADTDADVATGAGKALSRAPGQAVKLLDERLTAAKSLRVEDLPKLVDQLASDDPKTHLKAAAELRSFGAKASHALFAALAAKPDLATRNRIEEVLQFTGEFPIPPDELRRIRAIQLLEQIGTPRAEAILEKIAASQPPITAGSDAKAALERLRQRRRAPPSKVD